MNEIKVIKPSYLNEIYKEVMDLLSSNHDLFDENLLHEFEMNNRNLNQQIENIFEQNRLLKIGIVGEVKAGKSSFLNALLFNGEEILPKAATPMTAALTKIQYGETLGGKIVFYDQKDWELIERKSKQYKDEIMRLRNEFDNDQRLRRNGTNMPFNEEMFKRYIEQNISPDLKGCNELVEMVETLNINPYDYLGEIHELPNCNQHEEFLEQLNNYVGVNGKYTPLVKHTELQLNLPILEGIEIVDTPGTNDPIISRGMTTRDFLGECDVIFLLSYAGQFLTNEDVNFIVSTLPDKGIKNVVLIGSKFDSAILDNNKMKDDFIKAFKDTQNKLNLHAKKTLEKHLNEGYPTTLREVYNALPPIFVSSLFYNIAQKNFENLTEDESHVLKVFEKRYTTFQSKKDFLIKFSRIDEIKTRKLQPIIEKKSIIIQESIAEFENIKLKEFYKKILCVKENVESRQQLVVNRDLTEYETECKQILQRLSKGENDVKLLFARFEKDIDNKFKNLKSYLREKKSSYYNVDLNKGEREEKIKKRVFLWFKKEIIQKTYYDYITTTQIIKNIEDYMSEIERDTNEEFNRLIDLVSFKETLKKCVIDTCDLSEVSFDEDIILKSVELVLLELKIPDLDLSINRYKKIITDKYSDFIIEGKSDIYEAIDLQNNILNQVFEDVYSQIQQILEDIYSKCDSLSLKFIDTISTDLNNKLKQLKKQSEEKEIYLKKYDVFKQELLQLVNKITTTETMNR